MVLRLFWRQRLQRQGQSGAQHLGDLTQGYPFLRDGMIPRAYEPLTWLEDWQALKSGSQELQCAISLF